MVEFRSRDIRDKNRDAKKSWLASWKQMLEYAKSHLQQSVDRLQQLEKAQEKAWNYDEQKEKFDADIAKNTADVAAWTACNGVMTAELLPLWKEHEQQTYVRDFFGRSVTIVKPEPENFRGRIIAWIAYWPPSLFWTLLNDPIRKIGRAIYNMIAGLLTKISDSAWKDEDKLG